MGERIVYVGITAREMSFSSLVTSVPPQARQQSAWHYGPICIIQDPDRGRERSACRVVCYTSRSGIPPCPSVCLSTLQDGVLSEKTRDSDPMLGQRRRQWPNIGSVSRVCWKLVEKNHLTVYMIGVSYKTLYIHVHHICLLHFLPVLGYAVATCNSV